MSEGHGFESQHCKLDGHFVTFICYKNCFFEKAKINEKEARDGPFKKH